MKIIQPDDIKRINELYAQYHTYAEVSRQTGFAPSTVKKYVQKDFVPEDKRTYVRFEGPLPDFDPTIFRTDNWDPLCKLTDEEMEMMPGLWEELDQ